MYAWIFICMCRWYAKFGSLRSSNISLSSPVLLKRQVLFKYNTKVFGFIQAIRSGVTDLIRYLKIIASDKPRRYKQVESLGVLLVEHVGHPTLLCHFTLLLLSAHKPVILSPDLEISWNQCNTVRWQKNGQYIINCWSNGVFLGYCVEYQQYWAQDGALRNTKTTNVMAGDSFGNCYWLPPTRQVEGNLLMKNNARDT